MTAKDDVVYLKHILDAILKIEEYTGKVDSQTFFNDSLIQDGVIRQIEIIGEATKNTSLALRSKYDQIPWKDLGVDIDAVWDTVRKDLPVLKEKINQVLSKES